MDVEAYNKQRMNLISQDLSLRVDTKRPPLSKQEAQADAVVRQIRAEEAKTIWAAEHPEIIHPFPGMQFLTGKQLVMQTKIFKLLSKMPKGALLHAHLDATVDPAWLLSKAYEYPIMHVRIPEASPTTIGEASSSYDAHFPLTLDSLAGLLPEFSALANDELSSSLASTSSLTDASYKPGSWIPLKQAREQFSTSLGGPEAFDKWVLSTFTIAPNEAYNTIWVKFISTFRAVHGLIHFEPIFAEYVREFIRSSIEDGISYIEVRMNFWYKFIRRANGKNDLSHREMLAIVDNVVKRYKEDLKAEGREDELLGLRVIYTTVRIITNEELDWYLDDCIELKKEFPHLLAGFDLVGAENPGQPLTYYLERLLNFKKRQQEEGLEIPFVFHAGETEGDGTAADHNLYDAILLGTKRIGHGFALIKHPELIKLCREREIALEMCPISLRLTSSMPMHPLPALLNHGVPLTLSCDDPAVFGNMGLTFDFFQVLVSSEISGLVTMAEIARDSIKYSLMEKEEKVKALETYERKWQQFIQTIVDNEI
ncbi:hypothetical protein DL96DRAFT_1669676 [Flagelloscypha sp. PMI_526]|nr:hypothetical protein DL96DRAFT_1669676 [Flagelloscypha sp. PMI_526]